MKEDLHFFSSVSEAAPFVPELAGVSYCDDGYHVSRVCSSFCVIEYIAEGTGTLIVNGKEYTASEGEVYILAPGSRHTYYSDGENPWTKLFMNISGTMVAPMLEAYGLTEQVVFPCRSAELLFRELIETAFSELPQQTVTERCALKFHEILLHIAANAVPAPNVSKEAERLKSYLDSQMHRTVSTKELAAQIFRSEDFVIKLFKQSYGVTPHAYATRFKLRTAQKLLTETRVPIQEIAAALGYHDPQYFSNLFRKEVGLSPRAFRCREGHAVDPHIDG